MMLHTISCKPAMDAFRDCLRVASKGDAIVLLGDGVYSALPGSDARQALDECPARVLALDTDVTAAGLASRLNDLALVDMDGLVALSEYYPRQLAWY